MQKRIITHNKDFALLLWHVPTSSPTTPVIGAAIVGAKAVGAAKVIVGVIEASAGAVKAVVGATKAVVGASAPKNAVGTSNARCAS